MSADNPVDDLVEAAHSSVSAMSRRVSPNFTAMVARAHAQSPERISAEMVTEAATLAPVVDIRSRVAEPRDNVLDSLVSAAKEGVDRMVEGRRLAPIPPMRRPPRSRRMIAAIALVTAAAAAVVLVLALPRMAGQAQAIGAGETPAQAFHNSENEAPSGTALVPAPRPAASSRVELPASAPEEPLVELTAEEPQARARAQHHAAGELRELSEEAHALWRKGDLRGAEQRFIAITKIGGRGVLAELAWGDLFALARQMDDKGKSVTRWRAYLSKFPGGRYADDARAGLCRRSSDVRSCWSNYLRDMPRGSYRAEADAAVGSPGSEAP